MTTVPVPVDGEASIDPEPGKVVVFGWSGTLEDTIERLHERADPAAGQRVDGYDGRVRQLGALELTCETCALHCCELLASLSVHLRKRDDATVDAEELEDLEVLLGLRSPSFPLVDDEQACRGVAGTHHHRGNESFMTGDVDERCDVSGGESRRRESEVEGHAPSARRRQAVGVHAGENSDECRLTMVDMTGRRNHRHRFVTVFSEVASNVS